MDNLLKESLVYLESIPKGDHKLIMLIHRIKKKIKSRKIHNKYRL